MGKIKYLFKRIIKMDYKNMFRIAKAISKKTKKNYISIVIDMIKCGFKYQAGYYDYQEFEFYNLNNEERKTYLTRGKNNEIIKLTSTEFSLLALMAKNEGRVLTHTYILKEIWGYGYLEQTQYLRVFVAQLRKKIEDNPSKPQLLITESGIGYRFNGE